MSTKVPGRGGRHALGPATLLLLVACSTPVLSPSASPTESVAESTSPTTASSAPSTTEEFADHMPGMNANGEPAGVYGTVVDPTTTRWMHYVVEAPDYADYHEIEMRFSGADDCFAGAEGPAPVPAAVAGLDGLYVEPYEGPPVQFGPDQPYSMTTGAYALPVGDQTLCVYLSWNPATTAEELNAARQVVESIRARRYRQTDGIQFEFSLPGGWDTG